MADKGLARFRAAVLRALHRHLFEAKEGKLPRILPEAAEDAIPTTLSRDERLFVDIFWGTVEVLESQDALKDIETYMSRTRHSRLGVPKSRQLIYHVTNYFSELYIIRERIESFSKVLERRYGKSDPADLAIISSAGRRAITGLSGTVEVRGAHVHKRRFSDPELHELAGLEMVLKEEPNPMFARMAERLFRNQRARWRTFVRQNNALTWRILDEFFDVLYPVLFDDQGDVKRPRNWPDA